MNLVKYVPVYFAILKLVSSESDSRNGTLEVGSSRIVSNKNVTLPEPTEFANSTNGKSSNPALENDGVKDANKPSVESSTPQNTLQLTDSTTPGRFVSTGENSTSTSSPALDITKIQNKTVSKQTNKANASVLNEGQPNLGSEKGRENTFTNILTPATALNVNPTTSSRTGAGVAGPPSPKNEKSLPMNANDNLNSSVAPYGYQEKDFVPTTKKTETVEGKGRDAQLAQEIAASEIPKTILADSPALETSANGNTFEAKQINSTNSNLQIPTPSGQPESNVRTGETATPSASSDPIFVSGTTRSPQFTTTYFASENSNNKYENMAAKEEAEVMLGNHNNDTEEKIVATEKTLVGLPVGADHDLAYSEEESIATEHPSNSSDNVFSADNSSTSAHPENNSTSETPVVDSSTSPIIPTEILQNSNETGDIISDTSNNSVSVTSTPSSSEISTAPGATNGSTGWINGTRMPPLNSTANDRTIVSSLQDFFSELKKHTILCFICVSLFLLAISVILSLLIIVYYLCKYLVIGMIALCRRVGVCSKRKKSLGGLTEGSLFPRCDVSISPYVQNPAFRNGHHEGDNEIYQ